MLEVLRLLAVLQRFPAHQMAAYEVSQLNPPTDEWYIDQITLSAAVSDSASDHLRCGRDRRRPAAHAGRGGSGTSRPAGVG